MESYLGLILASILVIIVFRLSEVLLNLTWRPHVITKYYRQQGIQGPEYKFLKGCLEEAKSLKRNAQEITMDVDSHDITPRVLPHYLKWMSLYGRKCVHVNIFEQYNFVEIVLI